MTSKKEFEELNEIVSNTRNIMLSNIERVIERGERIEITGLEPRTLKKISLPFGGPPRPRPRPPVRPVPCATPAPINVPPITTECRVSVPEQTIPSSGFIPSEPPQTQTSSKVQQPSQPTFKSFDNEEATEEIEDYTKLPSTLDKRFELLDIDSALRPTIIKLDKFWTKKYQKSLVGSPVEETLDEKKQTDEKNQAFDLLDALSRSGALPIDDACLHIVVAAAHCFDKSLMDTLLKDNVNPIEKIERSTLIIATTLQNKPVQELIKDDQYERITAASPMLIEHRP
jgi:hypothetical protein